MIGILGGNRIGMEMIGLFLTAYFIIFLFYATFFFIRDFLLPVIFETVCNLSMYFFALILSVYKSYVKDYKTYFFTGCSLGLVFTSQWFY